MSPKRNQSNRTRGYRDREVNLEKIQCHKANIMKSIKESLLYKITFKDINTHYPNDFPKVYSKSLWHLSTYALGMDMGKMTELQDFYQCHEAGGLFEIHSNYIYDYHCRRRTVQWCLDIKFILLCSTHFQDPIQNMDSV